MATFTVTTLADAGLGSLRQAILDANATAGVVDDIVFAVNGTIAVTAVMTILDPVRIVGPGADRLTLDGGGVTRILEGGGVGTVISGLTLTRGRANVGGGGAINAGTLTLDRVAITNSSSATSGGAISSPFGATLTITNSSFVGNSAVTSGGAIGSGAVLSISNSTFSGNSADQSGAIENAGPSPVTISTSTFVGNQQTNAGTGGGAITGAGGVPVEIANSIFSGNISAGGNTLGGSVNVSYSLVDGATGVQVTLGAGMITGAPATAFTPGPLTLAGGLGLYLPPYASVTRDAGDPAYAGPLTVDQRGSLRLFGRLDMGSVEYLFLPPAPEPAPTPAPASWAAPITANFSNLLRFQTAGATPPLPATVTTPDGRTLPSPFLAQQAEVRSLIARMDAGALGLRAAQDLMVDMADGTTSVALMTYQFFTGKAPSRAGLDYLVSSPQNPADLNDGYYAGMNIENRYINFAVNLGKFGEGRTAFTADYGALTLNAATAKAYAEIFGEAADAAKLSAILTPDRTAYFNALGGDALGAKAAMVGWLLAEAAKSDTGPYSVATENFLYDLADGTAAFGADLAIYLNAGPRTVGLVGVGEA